MPGHMLAVVIFGIPAGAGLSMGQPVRMMLVE
jgi:hypothetical protein